MDIIKTLEKEFNRSKEILNRLIALIDDGNTIPFIARYRKEVTNNMDDQDLREFSERLLYLRNLEDRKETIIASITELDLMTDDILNSIKMSVTQTELEDIYRPYKPKRKTKASVAKEQGLEPLAILILENGNNQDLVENEANQYIDEEKKVASSKDAINGALDIIAEDIANNADIRKYLRATIMRTSNIVSETKLKNEEKNEKDVYGMYHNFNSLIGKLQNHNILAINRGEKENFLKVFFSFNETSLLDNTLDIYLSQKQVKSNNYLTNCNKDAFKRLIYPSVEREIRNLLTERASTSAISVFSKNLKQLLMQAPVKNKITLGLDPAYRTGCKLAVIDANGKMLTTTVIFPTPPQSKVEESEKTVVNLINKYNINLVVIGNGTASKESEIFISNLIKNNSLLNVSYTIVSEAGASVYSASKLAANEFPELDVSKRSAISIARRIQDPLAELVKIDPKSIGVGQYQHDMPQKELEVALNGTVESCVNLVGVNINTASVSLLKQVAGLKETIAKNIVTYREENGIFTNRKQLLKVSKLGEKAFLQSAGFLRILDGDNLLDNTGVHPESYKATKILLSNLSITDITSTDSKTKLENVDITEMATKMDLGKLTVKDIIDELLKPGRDPRENLPQPILRQDLMDITSLKVGDKVKGTVRNVIDFGAFVDIGVHIDGLVHISKLSKNFVKHPLDAVSVGNIVDVTVIDIDIVKKRISLSLID